MNLDNKTKNIATNYLAYLGGLFLLAGIGVYLGTFWDQLTILQRIGTTAGTGFFLYLLAIIFAKRAHYAKAVTPLILVAAPLQCSGFYIAAEELGIAWTFQDTSLVILCIMAFQYLLTFIALRRTAMLLTALFFGISFLGTFMDRIEVDPELISFTLGFSLLCIGYSIHNSTYRAISGLVFFFGSGMFYFGSFELLEEQGRELIFLGISCFLLFMSTVLQSRPLLSSSSLAILSFTAYYTNLHFVNSLIWPVSLLVLGFLCIGASAVCLRTSQIEEAIQA